MWGEGTRLPGGLAKKVSPQLYKQYPKKHKKLECLKSKGKGIVQFSKKYQNNIVAYILWGGLFLIAFFFYVKSIFGTLLLDFEGY